MKQAKKLTRQQKIMLADRGYEPRRYALLNDLPNTLVLRDKYTGLIEVVDKTK